MNTNTWHLTKPEHTILLAEDDPDDVFLFRCALEAANFNTRLWVACDGLEAIDCLERRGAFTGMTGNSTPSVMLLDLGIPYQDGFEVLAWVRKQPQFKRLVVIVFSSVERIEDINRAYDLGANSYLVKPVTFTGLVDLVESLHKYWLVSNRPAEPMNLPVEHVAPSERESVVPVHFV
jgi:CheY-like chemotaxis protein